MATWLGTGSDEPDRCFNVGGRCEPTESYYLASFAARRPLPMSATIPSGLRAVDQSAVSPRHRYAPSARNQKPDPPARRATARAGTDHLRPRSQSVSSFRKTPAFAHCLLNSGKLTFAPSRALLGCERGAMPVDGFVGVQDVHCSRPPQAAASCRRAGPSR